MKKKSKAKKPKLVKLWAILKYGGPEGAPRGFKTIHGTRDSAKKERRQIYGYADYQIVPIWVRESDLLKQACFKH